MFDWLRKLERKRRQKLEAELRFKESIKLANDAKLWGEVMEQGRLIGLRYDNNVVVGIVVELPGDRKYILRAQPKTRLMVDGYW